VPNSKIGLAEASLMDNNLTICVNVSALKAKNLDFNLATHPEICLELGARSKDQRLVKNFKQIDLYI
jgi:hypothetical protein